MRPEIGHSNDVDFLTSA